MHSISISEKLTFEIIELVIRENLKLELSDEAKEKIIDGRKYLESKINGNNTPIYGINTGFGSLCNTRVDEKDLVQLQENLVKSHACGTGDEVPQEVVKLMLLLKIQGLSYGNSGVQLETVERLIDFYNLDILPVVYQLGSLGASGDLAPLAHLSLPLIGLGEVNYKGNRRPSIEVLKQVKLKPIKLKSKEGLALLNGTQFMSAYGVWCVLNSKKISEWADVIGAISLEAFDGRPEPFSEHLHQIRPHKGQIDTAKNIRNILKGSQLINAQKKHVQDPYSFRCISQVHGASKDSLDYVANVFLTEINAVTDNPTLFPEQDEILSGGNFHGQPLAIAFDLLCIAMHELGNISERRTYQLICGLRGLPPYLIQNGGLNSGFMITQYTAASIVSQNKQLCTPASIDSIVSSNLQEDHVSMGANAATKCHKLVQNVQRILAIELMNASQAIEFRRPLKSSDVIENILKNFREEVPFIKEDKVMYEEMKKAEKFISSSPKLLIS
jgi:histidine ammonia-lyase